MSLKLTTTEICAILKSIAGDWLDAKYCLRKQAIELAAPEFCLSQPSFALALDWIFQQWIMPGKLCEVTAISPFPFAKFAVQILAGNTPAMMAQGLLQAILLGITQYIKLPARQTIFATLLQKSIYKLIPELAQLLTIDTWHNQLTQLYHGIAQADVVLAYGSDDTISRIRNYIPKKAKYYLHGHRTSAAIIFQDACNLTTLHDLTYDFLSYDQRGCLSPRVTFIQHGGEIPPQDCAHLFATSILPRQAVLFPRGGLFPGEAYAIRKQRDIYGCQGSLYCGDDWTVAYLDDFHWYLDTAVPRFMIFIPFTTEENLLNILESIKLRLLTLGIAGQGINISDKLNIKVCKLGKMQQQLLLW